jgi:hypothetical protein
MLGLILFMGLELLLFIIDLLSSLYRMIGWVFAHDSLVRRIRAFFAFLQMQLNEPTMHRCVRVQPSRYNEPNMC